jgi:putative hydrolase of the HAD superfamily
MSPIPAGVSPDLSKMQRFSAMLFDVYGTLLISGAGDIGFDQLHPGRKKKVFALLRRYGIGYTPEQLSAALQRAIDHSHALSRRKGISFPEVDIVQIWKTVLKSSDSERIKAFAMEYELVVNPICPMPGMRELLTACMDKGLCTGIISNAQFYTVSLLEHILGVSLTRFGFEKGLLFFSWREGHAKPSTWMFERAKKVLLGRGISADASLYVGNDLRKDILPAASVGFKTALFAGDRRSLRQREEDPRCRGIRPDLIVTDLHQLIACVNPTIA